MRNIKYLCLGLLIGFSLFNDYALIVLAGVSLYKLGSIVLKKQKQVPIPRTKGKPTPEQLADAILRKNPDLKSHFDTKKYSN